MAETALPKPRIIAELSRSSHGQLVDYLPVGSAAASTDAEFFAHLVAWNAIHGEIRDAKAALPVIALAFSPAYAENALAHLADLDPRTFLRACEFVRQVPQAPRRVIARLVARYLADLEQDGHFDRVAVQHRRTLARLYTLYHVKPSAHADAVVVKRQAPAGSIFDLVRRLPTMSADEAAGTVVRKKIPFLVAAGALGAKMKAPEVVMALIKAMTATELVTNMKRLEGLGVKDNPILRAALAEALGKAATSTQKGATLIAATAAAAQTDTVLKAKLTALQEQQIQRLAVEGDWLILADKSGSMDSAIETGRQIAGILGKAVSGRVHLVFFDTSPRAFDVTGQSYEDIAALTRTVVAGGGTSIGCGLLWLMEKGLTVDGIVVISDGAENTAPIFQRVYQAYTTKHGTTPAIYFYHLNGEHSVFMENCQTCQIDAQEFDLRGKAVDAYSLPNTVRTLKPGRYTLTDDIMAVPLQTLDAVLTRTIGRPVWTPWHGRNTHI